MFVASPEERCQYLGFIDAWRRRFSYLLLHFLLKPVGAISMAEHIVDLLRDKLARPFRFAAQADSIHRRIFDFAGIRPGSQYLFEARRSGDFSVAQKRAAARVGDNRASSRASGRDAMVGDGIRRRLPLAVVGRLVRNG